MDFPTNITVGVAKMTTCITGKCFFFKMNGYSKSCYATAVSRLFLVACIVSCYVSINLKAPDVVTLYYMFPTFTLDSRYI